jgi:hypothetical protein
MVSSIEYVQTVSLDCPFMIAPSVLSNVYFMKKSKNCSKYDISCEVC